MYGLWRSLAVRAEPETVLEEYPEWAVPNEIRGAPTAVCPGINFIVSQTSAGTTTVTQLTYVFDAATHRSFGLIWGSNGVRLRGEILHETSRDTLTLMDAGGTIVWTETHAWVSDDEFNSEAVMDFHGSEGRVWFRTYRVTGKE
jgi:hypothetical protein